VSVLPHRGDAVGANRDNVVYASSGGFGQDDSENRQIGNIAHFVMSAAAFGAWIASPQQGERKKLAWLSFQMTASSFFSRLAVIEVDFKIIFTEINVTE